MKISKKKDYEVMNLIVCRKSSRIGFGIAAQGTYLGESGRE